MNVQQPVKSHIYQLTYLPCNIGLTCIFCFCTGIFLLAFSLTTLEAVMERKHVKVASPEMRLEIAGVEPFSFTVKLDHFGINISYTLVYGSKDWQKHLQPSPGTQGSL